MDELKADFLEFAFEYYSRYAADYGLSEEIEPFLLWPLSYIQFAKEETNLFKLLFIKDMDLDMTEAKDFYKELGNEERAKAFSEIVGVQPEGGKKIFLDLFFYTHGIAVLAAAGKVLFDQTGCEKMLRNVLKALVKQEREKDGNKSVSD